MRSLGVARAQYGLIAALCGVLIACGGGDGGSPAGAPGGPQALLSTVTGNTPPQSHAGADQSVTVGTRVTLDASGSTDAEGDVLSFGWRLTEVPAGSAAALVGASSPQPSFVADVAGTYVATVVARDGRAEGAPATVRVVAGGGNVAPNARVEAPKTAGIGSVVTLDGSASADPNGEMLSYRWTLIGAPAGSAATLEGADRVRPTLRTDVAGRFEVRLVVSDGTLESVPVVVIIIAQSGNLRPWADAGAARSVAVGDSVRLDGTRSGDPDRDPLTYRWVLSERPAGSGATLSAADDARPGFVADVAGSYVARLVVSDGALESAPAWVSIEARPVAAGVPPQARAGAAQSVVTGQRVTLDGSASSDRDGGALTYRWTLTSRPGGSSATLAGAQTARPEFTADVAGSYVAALVVNNGRDDSAPATVTVTAATNAAPVGDAGSAASVLTGARVVLDGSRSYDPNGDPIAFAWTLTTRPPGSTAALAGAAGARPSFVADVAGTYVATLVVSDGRSSAAPATVVITASAAGAAPVADAGPDQVVMPQRAVQLDGRASYDADGDALAYGWTLVTRPVGSAAVLAAAGSAQPTFYADVAGDYVVRLVVSDGRFASAADTVVIRAAELTPVARGSFGGHGYEVYADRLSWRQAQAFARSRGGYLASIGSAAEDAFIAALAPDTLNPWIGLWQQPGSIEPAGGWVWDSGESTPYRAWAPNEPNDTGGVEAYAHLWGSRPGWNDTIDEPRAASGFVVEFDAPLPGSNAFALLAAPVVNRSLHTATLLRDGSVLLVGGATATGPAEMEVFDPRARTFESVGPVRPEVPGGFPSPYSGHVAALLPDGRVLLAGGDAVLIPAQSAELFDPRSRTVTATGPMTVPRKGATATPLPNGTVLVTGGVVANRFTPTTEAAEIYDPATGRFAATGSMLTSRALHTATRLRDGRVLITGGVKSGFMVEDSGPRNTAEIYDPATGTFQAAGWMRIAREGHTATLLPDGRVLITGGLTNRQADPPMTALAEIFDPGTGQFSPTGTMLSRRSGHAAAALLDGSVLITGGQTFSLSQGGIPSAEIYSPVTGQFTAVNPMNLQRYGHTATPLSSGQVLIVGGVQGPSATPAAAELFTP